MDIVEIKNHQMLLAGSVSMDLVDEPTIDPGTIDAPPMGPDLPGMGGLSGLPGMGVIDW